MKFGTEVMSFKDLDAIIFNPIASIILKSLRFRVVRLALVICGFGLCSMVTMATKLFTAVNAVKLS
jgi:hypothetical protein